MKATTIALIAVVVFSTTAIFIGARNAEYNRYEISASHHDTTIAAYKLDKRTGKTWCIIGLKEIETKPSEVMTSGKIMTELGIKLPQ